MTMTVKELIEELNNYPENFIIYGIGHFEGKAEVEYTQIHTSNGEVYLALEKPIPNE
jgi:hypothetical protein